MTRDSSLFMFLYSLFLDVDTSMCSAISVVLAIIGFYRGKMNINMGVDMNNTSDFILLQ